MIRKKIFLSIFLTKKRTQIRMTSQIVPSYDDNGFTCGTIYSDVSPQRLVDFLGINSSNAKYFYWNDSESGKHHIVFILHRSIIEKFQSYGGAYGTMSFMRFDVAPESAWKINVPPKIRDENLNEVLLTDPSGAGINRLLTLIGKKLEEVSSFTGITIQSFGAYEFTQAPKGGMLIILNPRPEVNLLWLSTARKLLNGSTFEDSNSRFWVGRI